MRFLSRLVLYRTNEEVDFSFRYFIAFVVIQTGLFMALIYVVCLLADRNLLKTQLETSKLVYLSCFAVAHLVLSFFEYIFHRYVLHLVWLPWLAALKRKHTEHHQLTNVREVKVPLDEKGQAGVSNKYPITEPEQIRSSAFPGWALVAFWGIFSLLIIPLQFVLPNLPILFAGYLAVVFSFSLYEIVHAIEHLDYERYWKRLVERYPLVRRIYGFHLMHHSRVGVNQAIGGFFGFPIWDWIFGTYFVPDELPLSKAKVRPATQDPPAPCRLIRWLDRLAARADDRFKDWQKKAELIKRGLP